MDQVGGKSRRMTIRAVYISGPYTVGDQAINVRNAMIAGTQLLEAGLLPFVPHLSHFWHMLSPRSWGQWIDYDLAWLNRCDVMLRLPGVSNGADLEEKEAKRLGIRVYHNLGLLIEEHGTRLR